MTTYYAKRGDDGSITPETVLQDGDGNAVNINGGTVRFLMRAPGAATAKVSEDAENLQEGDGSDGSKGKVGYIWQEADLDTPGFYRAEYEVTFSDNSVQTFPVSEYISVWVRPDLDDEES